MLVLTRKSGQSVLIEHAGEVAEITAEVVNGRIRLIFDAPTAFDIVRTEVLTRESEAKNGHRSE